MKKNKKFPHYRQPDSKDCGPTSLRIVTKYYGKNMSLQDIRILSETQRDGTTLTGLSTAAEAIGFRTLGVKISLNRLLEAPLPCIVYYNKNNHYTVLYKIKKGIFYLSDPAYGLLKYTEREFLNQWIGNTADETTEEGVVMLLETTPDFLKDSLESKKDKKLGISFLNAYILKHREFVIQLFIGLISSTIIQFIFPFLTQSIIDVGIKNQDVNFIYLVLTAQLFLFFGKLSINVIRSWILLHLSTRINISLISDFFIKLMKLPIAFFDTRMTGDLLERIKDHERVEKILTSSSLDVIFSLFNLIVFGFILLYYNIKIFFIFFLGSGLYVLWITLFLERRAKLDYKRFSEISKEQSKVIELINGMQEIKLHNAEKQKRWEWEYLQARLFKVSIDGLALEQYQNVGSSFINELKNILITIISATLVIEGQITIGMMLAISYIVGQLNGPITQLINFIRELQDAKISLDRLSEIHFKEKEDEDFSSFNNEIPQKDIHLQNLSFRYPGMESPVFNNLNLSIPYNKVTAIVGVSGGGKTTLLKLLLKFYEAQKGTIQIGNINLKSISQLSWREQCGVVMQEGYIFSDTIARNIALGKEEVHKDRLLKSVEIASIKDFIESLPLSYNTKIGMDGLDLSTGQKQRILIARAVYKNPDFLFFDEATSALDTKNEKNIVNKLNSFFKNKTVVIIAHRLSTIKNADQIVVLNRGEISEQGTHEELITKEGFYYDLVKDQLNIGK
ncbi:peptidase domain-containing ABC transporter [Tenacibaculum agarivorans]|uniref:peptidase domain-containing ABC transporter n=1 Tax=Tenacibaculum agarivorans TaxID=1908389 RepID=UPI00094BB1CF|nr:peptidase domain-containing ABC transporter [Tenacibaculum agarivorans]